jgi:hypothetical protein
MRVMMTMQIIVPAGDVVIKTINGGDGIVVTVIGMKVG